MKYKWLLLFVITLMWKKKNCSCLSEQKNPFSAILTPFFSLYYLC